MQNRHYFTDATTSTLTYVGDGGPVVDGDIDPDEAETVTLDSPWNEMFDTDEYVRFEATVAKPIEQTYIHDGEVKTFRKSKQELRQAQAQIDNLPWTRGHPDDKRVRTASQIDGFWRDPQYADGQQATLYIPANDTDAIRYAVHNDGVSVGFSGVLDWTDDEDGVDAVQRDMAYDHIASVESGRCSREDGCGLHTDGQGVFSDIASAHGHDHATNDRGYDEFRETRHGHVHEDAVRTKQTKEDKTEAREERAEYRYETKQAAREAATELDCADVDDPVHSHETPDGTVYMPCMDHATFRVAFGRERGDEFTYDNTLIRQLADDVGEQQRDAIKTIRDEHDKMDTSEISPNMSTLVEVYQRGAAAWQQSHAPGANQQQWALARVREFLRDLRNGNALNSGADNDLAPEGYDPPKGSQSTGDSVHGSSGSMNLSDHRYDTEDAVREAADEIGCDGVHQHDDGTWMPCESMSTLKDMVDTACGCDANGHGGYVGPCSPGPCSCGLHVAGDAKINGKTIDLSVPDGAQSAAQAYLDAREQGVIPEDCGTGVGTESAKMIATGEVTAERLVGDIAPYLNSHEDDPSTDTHPSNWSTDADSDTPWQDCGDAQYAAWGWHSLTDWARRKADQIKRARGEEPVYTDVTVMDTISYEGTREGDLDESKISNEEYEAHYVFDANTKTDSSFPLVDADGFLRRANVIAAASFSEYADDEGFLMDVLREVNDDFEDPPLTEDTLQTDTTPSAPLAKRDVLADTNTDTQTMTTIEELFEDNDITREQVLDHYDIDLKESPQDFYDGEPTIEAIADDFPTVQMLLDEKESLDSEVADLEDELRETKRPAYKEAVDELTDIADDAFGTEDELLDAFDADDEAKRLTVDDIEDKIAKAKQIKGTDPTTVADDGDDDGIERPDVTTSADSLSDSDGVTVTPSGKYDLSGKR